MSSPEHASKSPERAADAARAPGRDTAAPGPATGAPGYVRDLIGIQASAGNRAVLQLLGKGQGSSAGAGGGMAPPRFEPPAGVGVLATGSWKFGRHPDFPAAMGQTWYAHNDIGQWPSFNVEYSRSFLPPFRHQARPKTTDAVGAAWPVLATKENEDGYKMPDAHPSHPGLDYYIRVSGTAANNIAAAEQQHVNDLDEGWDLTGRKAKLAINRAAGEDWSEGEDMPAAKAAAIDKTVGYMGALGPKVKSTMEGGGSLEPALGSMMDKSFTQSKSQRDGTGKHTIPVVYVTKDADQTKVLYEADPDKTLDTTPTSTIVNLGTIS